MIFSTLSLNPQHIHLTQMLISKPSPNHLQTISKPSPNHLKTISKPSQNHLKTISNHLKPSRNHLETISKPSHNHLKTISKPSQVHGRQQIPSRLTLSFLAHFTYEI
ncbi:hypothetical protein M758_12G066700 [Ceratodon purpureus]|nr:hypothetical protein M758_12G066700 [Ceratodon purpureus]